MASNSNTEAGGIRHRQVPNSLLNVSIGLGRFGTVYNTTWHVEPISAFKKMLIFINVDVNTSIDMFHQITLTYCSLQLKKKYV